MSMWLQKRLAIWMGVSLCGGALVWNSGASRAQNHSDAEVAKLVKPGRKLARVEAAKLFADFMDAETQPSGDPYVNAAKGIASVSLKSKRQLGGADFKLARKMVSQWKQNKLTIKAKSQSSKATAKTDAEATTRALVLTAENGGWGVDLVETYAKCNHLEGAAKAEAIFNITGMILEDLPRTESLNRSACQSNLKQIAFGMMQYAQDYDEKLPPAKQWVDAVRLYVSREAIFHCPSLPKGQRYGYAFNSNLADKGLNFVRNSSQTSSFYETTILKRNAYGIGENLAFRHQNGANYAFADGHVKWFAKTATPSFKLKP